MEPPVFASRNILIKPKNIIRILRINLFIIYCVGFIITNLNVCRFVFIFSYYCFVEYIVTVRDKILDLSVIG